MPDTEFLVEFEVSLLSHGFSIPVREKEEHGWYFQILWDNQIAGFLLAFDIISSVDSVSLFIEELERRFDARS